MKTMTSVEQYSATRTKSKNLYDQAERFFPSGVTHDTRFMKPFPIYVTHAQGSRKWDVDGNEYIDYMTGHGAMIRGHGNPRVVEAVCEQMRKGTHYGSCHELEVEWGQVIQDLAKSRSAPAQFHLDSESGVIDGDSSSRSDEVSQELLVSQQLVSSFRRDERHSTSLAAGRPASPKPSPRPASHPSSTREREDRGSVPRDSHAMGERARGEGLCAGLI